MTLEETYSVWMAKYPLTGELERLLNKKFTIEYNFNSNHIEGNTLTYGQTELLLLFGRVTGGSEVKDYELKSVGWSESCSSTFFSNVLDCVRREDASLVNPWALRSLK